MVRSYALEEIEGCAEDDPLDAVLVALAEGLPDGLFLGRLAGYADAGAAAVGARGVLLDLAKFDALGRDVMPGVGKIEHAPKGSIWVGL